MCMATNPQIYMYAKLCSCESCWVIDEFCPLIKKGHRPGPEVIKLFSCSAQLRPEFIQLMNHVKMPTIAGILTFMSRINY